MKRKFKRRGVFYVYILECADGIYYTGSTNDLEKRIKEHNDSRRGGKYTRDRRPVKLVYVKEYKYYKNAIKTERKLKRLPRRRKEELIGIYGRKRTE